jgi:hypothetical protein
LLVDPAASGLPGRITGSPTADEVQPRHQGSARFDALGIPSELDENRLRYIFGFGRRTELSEADLISAVLCCGGEPGIDAYARPRRASGWGGGR